MSYYMGDYYRGDPGFFSFLGKIAKGVGGMLLGGGGGGGEASAAGAGLSKYYPQAQKIMRQAGAAIVKHPVLSGAGAAGVIGAAGATMGRRGGRMGAAGMAGYPKSEWARKYARFDTGYKRRRMHVTNVKALRRAIRRAKGFEKLARRVMHFTSPRAPKGRAVFKIRRRKRI